MVLALRSAAHCWRLWKIISRRTDQFSFPKRSGAICAWNASPLMVRKKKQLRILVCNDDGIHAPGLAVAEEIARSLSDNIWVVAPETEQSGASHSLTLTLPLRLRQAGPPR